MTVSCWICKKSFPTKAASNRHRREAHAIKVNSNLTVEFIMPWSAFSHKKHIKEANQNAL
jgi:hypothetical protein